jgi:hypothetical protein
VSPLTKPSRDTKSNKKDSSKLILPDLLQKKETKRIKATSVSGDIRNNTFYKNGTGVSEVNQSHFVKNAYVDNNSPMASDDKSFFKSDVVKLKLVNNPSLPKVS